MADDAPATILLVEDDRLLRDAFRMLLEDAGYRITEAGTAGEAIELASGDPRPGLVILDLGLPDRPGLDVARELRAHDATRATPIVALTGRVGAAEQRACIEAGCDLYLSKPIGPKELLRKIEPLLR